jgi:dGTPase
VSTIPRKIKEKIEEAVLSPFATQAAASRGRQKDEPPCTVRTIFERDVGRILYSQPFRRLRHKTQVFFNPQSDHICTRMEHVLYVAYVAETIGKTLGLNTDLIRAIAYGHDLGHPPFGHAGERSIGKILATLEADFQFEHERHSLRVVDLLASHNSTDGLNLSFEVRDGIRNHCGEVSNEFILVPDRKKQEDDLDKEEGRPLPSTLEGCLVRLVDRIAYVGRDIEDAQRAGMMHFSDLPADIRRHLGHSNSEIVNNLVIDVVRESYGKDIIAMSEVTSSRLDRVVRQNVEQIYQSEKIRQFEQMAETILTGLFVAFLPYANDPEMRKKAAEPRVVQFSEFVDRHVERESATGIRLVTDYVAGMTDSFARTVYDDIYLV